jgi:hypothetical protein
MPSRKTLVTLLALWALAIAAFVIFSGCQSNADKVNDNIKKDCEQFKCQRRIVGVNGITDKVEFEIEGRCSIEGDGLGNLHALIVTCEQSKGEYKKHYVGMSDNMFFISTQLKALPESIYHTKVILKPQNLIPDVDLVTGGG